jgi:acyl carrier protein
MEKEEVNKLILSSLHEILLEKHEEEQLPMPFVDESTRLIGRKSVLDSLALVTLIVNVEQKLMDDYDIAVTIADERAMSQEKSPFRTVESLSGYIFMLIQEQKQDGI